MKNASYILLCFTLLPGCNSDKNQKSEVVVSDTGSFPGMFYDEVRILSLDSSVYFLGTELYKKNWLIKGTFLDSIGKPLHQKYVSKTLSEKEIKDLRQILDVNCTAAERTIKDCFPFYRDAIVFYEKKKPVAFINICFQCEELTFSTKSADFFCLQDKIYTDLIDFFVKTGFPRAKKVNVRIQNQFDTLRQ